MCSLAVRPLKIGDFLCPSNLFLAPLAGVTDPPFRRMCLHGGCGLVFGEMVSAQALTYLNPKSCRMLALEKHDHPCAIQIFGGDERAIFTAAKMAETCGADVVDINSGCPVKKINKSGAGVVLMKNELVFARVVSAAVRAVKIPVTVKIRCGFKTGEILSPKFAKIAESEGAKAVAVHARPAENMHSGPVYLDTLEKTASAVKIPVIGNGGVDCALKAKLMFEAGCSGVMIGRAALGNPDIFNEVKLALEGNPVPKTPPRQKACKFLELIKDNAAYYGEAEGLLRARKVIGYWIRDFPSSSALRLRCVQAKTVSEIKTAIEELLPAI